MADDVGGSLEVPRGNILEGAIMLGDGESAGGISTGLLIKNEVFSYEDIDPVLSQKMKLVNNAIDEIGFTPYHWKLFILNGFGYAVDSLLILLQSIVQPQVAKEMNPSFPRGLTIALYVGLLLGALFWGLTADMIGRRWAFNTSLILCSIFAIIAGWANSYPVLGFLVAMSGAFQYLFAQLCTW